MNFGPGLGCKVRFVSHTKQKEYGKKKLLVRLGEMEITIIGLKKKYKISMSHIKIEKRVHLKD